MEVSPAQVKRSPEDLIIDDFKFKGADVTIWDQF
jgi:hypothetical protein